MVDELCTKCGDPFSAHSQRDDAGYDTGICYVPGCECVVFHPPCYAPVTREESNRRLARWLGYTELRVHTRTLKKTRLWVPDFYTNETENARLLDKMPEPSLSRTKKLWCCTADNSEERRYSGRGIPWAYGDDRKAVVVLAALNFIEETEQEKNST